MNPRTARLLRWPRVPQVALMVPVALLGACAGSGEQPPPAPPASSTAPRISGAVVIGAAPAGLGQEWVGFSQAYIASGRAALAGALRYRGIEVQTISGAEATATAILAGLRSAAENLGDDEALLVSYQGYGTRVRDRGEEPDGWAEAWVGADLAVVTEDEIAAALARARGQVVVLTECGYGGPVSSTPDHGVRSYLSPAWLVRFRSEPNHSSTFVAGSANEPTAALREACPGWRALSPEHGLDDLRGLWFWMSAASDLQAPAIASGTELSPWVRGWCKIFASDQDLWSAETFDALGRQLADNPSATPAWRGDQTTPWPRWG